MSEKNASNVELRSATEGDFDAIAHVWHASASLIGVGPPHMPTVDELRSRIDNEIELGWSLFVATKGGKVVGMLALKLKEAVLDQIFVDPAHLGFGIGKVLMKFAMEAMPLGFTLHTASSNVRAKEFYERAGLRFLRKDCHPRTQHPVFYYGWIVS